MSQQDVTTPTHNRPRRLAGMLAVVIAAAGLATVGPGPAQAAGLCPDVHVVFARGTGELPGLGVLGGPFASSLASALPGKTVTNYAVNYAADFAQFGAGAGATDMTNHIVSLAAECANTRFVIGGYSQGATVTDISAGIRTILGSGTAIPDALAPRVVAVVTFGNPIRLTGSSIAIASPTYAPKWKDFCAFGDPVCAGGVNFLSHLSYMFNGDTTSGAQFAAEKVLAAG